MNFEISLTFQLEFNIDLEDPTSELYQTFSNNVTDTLNAIISSTNLMVSGTGSLTWTFSPGSIIAEATKVPILNATSVDEAQAEFERAAGTSNIPLPGLSAIKLQGRHTANLWITILMFFFSFNTFRTQNSYVWVLVRG